MKHKHRYDTCADCGWVKVKRQKLLSHDERCNCAVAGHDCYKLRHQEFLLAQGAWVAEHPEIISWYGNLVETDNHTTHSAPTVKLESISDIEARLSVCACGHIASTHDVDAMGNILSCTVKNCRCDHFHYDAGKVAA